LNDGSFSGTATLPYLPGPNSSVNSYPSGSADVNFYDSTGHLVFSIDGYTYNTMSANGSGYTLLTISGIANGPCGYVDVAPLSLELCWPFGNDTGTVKPYGAPNYDSYIEYTYENCGTTYYDPICLGTASVPEPSAIALGLIGMSSAVIYVRCKRRKVTTWAPAAGVAPTLQASFLRPCRVGETHQ
jgi:hypothetical protein